MDKTVNKTRLRERILLQSEDLQVQTDGKNTILVFDESLKSFLKDSVKSRHAEKETIHMANTVKTIREDMFNFEGFKFSGSFPVKCQQASVPPSLICLVSMLLNGTNIKDQENGEVSQACLSIAQLILFNSKKNLPLLPRRTLETV